MLDTRESVELCKKEAGHSRRGPAGKKTRRAAGFQGLRGQG